MIGMRRKTPASLCEKYHCKKMQDETKKKIPSAGIRVFSPPSIPGLSAVGGFEFKVTKP